MTPPQKPLSKRSSPVRVRYPRDSNHSPAVRSASGSRPTLKSWTREVTSGARGGSDAGAGGSDASPRGEEAKAKARAEEPAPEGSCAREGSGEGDGGGERDANGRGEGGVIPYSARARR